MTDKTTHIRRTLCSIPPTTPDELHGWLRAVLGLFIPRRPLVAGHAAPFDYLCHAFFEDSPGPRDAVVWANRGGGKTLLGAVATLLDLLFKPGVQIRILGGSMEQSERMYEYLRTMLEREEFRDLIRGKTRQRGVRLANGSQVELLAQSETSVRGHRVQKLRCDEVELFQSEIWQAAQLVTRSEQCGEVYVRGCIECLSTMHRPYGLMAELTAAPASDSAAVRQVFRWGLLDVIAACPPERQCAACSLWPDCEGVAKAGRGHITVEDALQQRARTEIETWQAEMLCLRPSRTNSVYSTFDQAVHVQTWDGKETEGVCIGGMDFGFRSPTVVLWGVHLPDDRLWIVSEYLARERTMAEHLEAILGAERPRLDWIGIDPAGVSGNEHSGKSNARLLREAGLTPKIRRGRIEAGLDLVRRRLRTADGEVRLFIDPACPRLIEALERYHYPEATEEDAAPVKDGWDHAADALRYLVTNLDRDSAAVEVRGY
jgi:Terminase RNaseH-like domain